MSHVKASKRRGSKKSSSVLTYTDANVAAARPVNDAFEPSKPRSRSQSIPQVLAEADIPPTRRRAATRASTEPSSTGLAPDVFQFLDREQSDADAHARKAAERRYTDQGANTRPSQQDHSRKASTTYSFRSDSGVSVRGHSPGRASSVASGDEYQPPTPPDVPLDTMKWGFGKTVRAKRPGPMAGAYLTDTESVFENPAASAPTLLDLSAPESFYYGKHLQKPSSSKRTMPQRPNIDTLKTAQQSRRPSQASASPKSSSTPKPPPESRPRIYRKFDALNHRLLRHLQEEITQLEEDLKTLDDLEAAHQASPETRNSPRQRMLAAKYHDLQIQDYSVLHYKRTDLLEKIAVKTEQYSE